MTQSGSSIFGSESMNNILQKLGLKDGESIDHPWINKALERAQQKVEARNFDIRKTLIKFDNVLNDQRHVIFSQRESAMNTDKIFNYSDDFLNEIIKNLIELKKLKLSDTKNNDFEIKLKSILGKNFEEIEFDKLKSLNEKEFKEKIFSKFNEMRENRINLLGKNQSQDIEKKIFLQTLDMNWKSHIQYLEQLRQVIGLRSYGQRDPLIEYKKEAFELFENLLNKLKLDLVTVLMNLKLIQNETNKVNLDKKDNQKCLLIIKKNQKISRND